MHCPCRIICFFDVGEDVEAGGVFRIIPTEILSAEKLGLSKEICDLAYLTKGLVLVTGPTGSGKTTTLYAALNQVKNDTIKILTIEDPVEYYIDGIQQVMIGFAAPIYLFGIPVIQPRPSVRTM